MRACESGVPECGRILVIMPLCRSGSRVVLLSLVVIVDGLQLDRGVIDIAAVPY